MATVDDCIRCGKCTASCEFLEKYKLDFSCKKELEELAYHCFLCGRCTEVCPVGIDGRQYILDLRRKKVTDNKGKVPGSGYGMMIKEKRNYLFKNYKNAQAKSVFFPGCSLPSHFPETTRKTIDVLSSHGDVGVAFDCCGKPISELGMLDDENRIIKDINENLERCGAEELVTACVNCYYFFEGKLNVRLVNIYDKLKELGLGEKIEKENMEIYLPCPDRTKQKMLEDLKYFLPEDFVQTNEKQCCGLGGSARIREPELAEGFAKAFTKESDKKPYVYCASCAGNFHRAGGTGVNHVLTEILSTDEKADIKKSLINRIRMRNF